MKLFKKMKDGGPESRVWGYWLVEIKSLFSMVLLHFKDGSREAYHSHAFNALSWVLRGKLKEDRIIVESNGKTTHNTWNIYKASLKPIWTGRNNMHKVTSVGDTWVLSFRGPWNPVWFEYIPREGKMLALTHGREVLEEYGAKG
jgi:hypothetical protein